jgi:hypothetical protein
MSALDSGIKKLLVNYNASTVIPVQINADPKTVSDIVYTHFEALMLGSTNGSSYGLSSIVDIPVAYAGWRDLSIAITNGATSHDQNITLAIYWGSTYGCYGLVSKFIIPQTASQIFIISSGGEVGLGGEAGISLIPNNYSYFHVPALHLAPLVRMIFTAANLPTAGALARISAHRTA